MVEDPILNDFDLKRAGMKTSDLWKKLPTAAELLENPRVKSVVDRLHPNVVTAQVRTFLDDVRADLAHRAEEANVPSFSELAERVSRYLSGADSFKVGGAINATGRFRGSPWVSSPLPEAAVERMLLTAQDFTLSVGDGGLSNGHADQDACRLLCELTGAEAAAVFSSHPAAIELALRTQTSNNSVVIARGEVGTIDAPCRLTDLATAANVSLLEVGAADSVNANDYERALDGRPATVLRMGSTVNPLSACRPALEELVQTAKRSGGSVVVELGGAALRPLAGLEPLLPSLQEAIHTGADLVLARGDGLIGGPECGIAVGATAAVERLLGSPLLATCRATGRQAGALAATLQLHATPERAELSVPVLSLVTAPIDNLKSRAERLAPQLDAAPQYSAEAVELAGSPIGGLPICLPSWGIRVRPTESTAEALSRRLLERSPAVAAEVEGDSLLLNLRTVFARQDLDLVAAFEGNDSAGSDEQSDQPPVV
ncbi:L-seryl-tRNA(Sec) selenium transferase [Posidoniimonas polymericola]|uniref:L-seryl-tRNA(Sec) selenium transferase n=1 Tax=Posidoniimonas polymericola TaxID=2528002 RepID=A0A5C5YAJ0_9BACT|nr:hypothetical protein [Posidoniimonas polymericola]TWT72716.1 L-seryl-tRNA(Sec) selenium transferase [Posidoniimonas polymericola]